MTSDLVPAAWRRTFRALADGIRKYAAEPIANKPRHDVVWGQVTAVTAGTPNTLTVTIQGDTVPWADIKYLDSYTPTVGDIVMMTHYGTDLVVVGTLSSGAAPASTSGDTFAIIGSVTNSSVLPVPGFFWVSGKRIVKVEYELIAGTCTVDVQDNGTTISGLGGLSLTTSPASTTLTPAYRPTTGHLISIHISAASSAKGLSLTISSR